MNKTIQIYLLSLIILSFSFRICPAEGRPDGRNLLKAPEITRDDKTEAGRYTVRYSLKTVPLPGAAGKSGGFSSFSSGTDNPPPETRAEIAVNILGPNFIPVRTYLLHNAEKIDNLVTLWDGLDMYGRKSPPGTYYASLSIIYSDGRKETKFFRFAVAQPQ